jgi:phospholipase/carboxylesterase
MGVFRQHRVDERVLVLLHGVGSNERNLLAVGPMLAPDRTIVSLRSPRIIGPEAYA